MEEKRSEIISLKNLLSSAPAVAVKEKIEETERTGESVQVLRTPKNYTTRSGYHPWDYQPVRTPKNFITRSGYHPSEYQPIRTGALPKQSKVKCPECDTMLYPKTLLVHKRYFCNKEPPTHLKFKMMNNHLALCLKCKRHQHHESIILHSQYLCKNRFVRCFYCPAVFKGHTNKKSPLMGHISHIHSKGMYEVNDLVSKLGPEDFHEDENGVVYTSYQPFEVQGQARDSTGNRENVVEKKFVKVLIKQENKDPFENGLIKQEDNLSENVFIKQEYKELSEEFKDSQYDLHCVYSKTSFSNVSVEKDFIPPSHCVYSKTSFSNVSVEKDFIPPSHCVYSKTSFCNVSAEKDFIPPSKCKKDLLSVCPKCSKLICPSVMRLHKKYFCGKLPDDRLEWKINNSPTTGASCLRCGKTTIHPNFIEFHVAYMCGKIPMSVQCFYCDQFHDNYKSLLNHMKYIHHRKHEWLDLLSVLPPAEHLNLKNPVENIDESKVVKVYFGGFNNTLQNWNDPRFSKSKVGQDMYKCFYCAASYDHIFLTLDHMEEEHFMKHSTYDVLREMF